MRERKPVIGVTCNFDYRDAVGMVSGRQISRLFLSVILL